MESFIGNTVNPTQLLTANSQNTACINNIFIIKDTPQKYTSTTKNINDRKCINKNNNDLRKSYGGKGSSLELLKNAQIPVPEFQFISISAVNSLLDEPIDPEILKKNFSDINFAQLTEYNITAIKDYINNLADQNTTIKKNILASLAKFICSNDFYQQIKNTTDANNIRLKYNNLLCLFHDDTPIIVRSSSITEDDYGDAQAGKYESIVHKHQDILQTCLEVIASSLQPEICMLNPQPIALILQQCVDCSFGGVAMSYSALQDDSIRVEYTLGQPKGAVAGQSGITAHSYSINRDEKFTAHFNLGDIKSYYSLEKHSETAGYSEQLQSLTDSKQQQELDENILIELKTYLETLENIFICPIDVEFAIDKNNNLFILQVRPITKLSGGVNFAMDAPTDSLAKGLLISEGFCAGTLVKFDSTCDIATIPAGAIIYAKHGNDKMLEANYLQHVGGFILQQGGLNDHIAITLRQASKPCLVAKVAFTTVDYNNLLITLAGGNFNGVSGAYVVKDDITQKLQSVAIPTNSLANYQFAQQNFAEEIREINFTSPDTAFAWLNQQNSYLLNYFAPDRLINICLANSNPLQLAMSANRLEFFNSLKFEINSLLANLKLLLDRYEYFLSIGNNSKQPITAEDDLLLKTKLEEYKQIKSIYNHLVINIKEYIDYIQCNLTASTNSMTFTNWLAKCKSLLNYTQQLNSPKAITDLKSVHDIIFWIHKEFVGCLASVTIASQMGIIKAKNKSLFIDFTQDQSPDGKLLDERCKKELINYNRNLTVIEMPYATFINIKLGMHICVIEMLEQAEANKGRVLRIKLTDDFNDKDNFTGKLKRFWIFQQILRGIAQEQESTEFNISLNSAVGSLTVEFAHIESKNIMQQTFIKLMEILYWTINLDMYIENDILLTDVCNWDFAFLEYLINNSAAEKVEDDFIYALLRINYLNEEPLTFTADKHKKWDAIFHEVVKLTNLNAITSILDKFLEKEKLLHYLFIFKPCIYRHIIKNKDWQTNKNIATNLVYKNTKIFQYLSNELRNDESFFRSIAKNKPAIFGYISETLANNKQLFLDFLHKDGEYIMFASDELKNDLEISLLAVKHSKDAITHLSLNMQTNLQVITTSLKNKPLSIKHIDSTLLKDNINLVIDTVAIAGHVLILLDEELQNNLNIVIVAVKNEPYVYKYLSIELRDNTQLGKIAIEQDGLNYKYASKRLKNNPDFFALAIQQNGTVLRLAEQEEFKTADNVLLAIKNNGKALEHAPEQYKNNIEYVMVAVNQVVYAIQYASYEIRNNYEIMVPLISKEGKLLQYAGNDCRNNLKLVKAAIINNPSAIMFASNEVKQQLEMKI